MVIDIARLGAGKGFNRRKNVGNHQYSQHIEDLQDLEGSQSGLSRPGKQGHWDEGLTTHGFLMSLGLSMKMSALKYFLMSLRASEAIRERLDLSQLNA